MYGVLDGPTGRLFTIDGIQGVVRILDGASGRLLGTVSVGGTPANMVIDQLSGQAFLACVGPLNQARQPMGNGTVSMLDGRSGAVIRTVAVGRSPFGVAIDPREQRVLVFNNGGQTAPVPDPWSWIPGRLRQVLPFIPRRGATTRTLPGSVTVLDLTALRPGSG